MVVVVVVVVLCDDGGARLDETNTHTCTNTGLELKSDQDGIHIVMDPRGRATGEAFVQFVSQEDTEQALKRNREKIGHRWVLHQTVK